MVGIDNTKIDARGPRGGGQAPRVAGQIKRYGIEEGVVQDLIAQPARSAMRVRPSGP